MANKNNKTKKKYQGGLFRGFGRRRSTSSNRNITTKRNPKKMMPKMMMRKRSMNSTQKNTLVNPKPFKQTLTRKAANMTKNSFHSARKVMEKHYDSENKSWPIIDHTISVIDEKKDLDLFKPMKNRLETLVQNIEDAKENYITVKEDHDAAKDQLDTAKENYVLKNKDFDNAAKELNELYRDAKDIGGKMLQKIEKEKNRTLQQEETEKKRLHEKDLKIKNMKDRLDAINQDKKSATPSNLSVLIEVKDFIFELDHKNKQDHINSEYFSVLYEKLINAIENFEKALSQLERNTIRLGSKILALRAKFDEFKGEFKKNIQTPQQTGNNVFNPLVPKNNLNSAQTQVPLAKANPVPLTVATRFPSHEFEKLSANQNPFNANQNPFNPNNDEIDLPVPPLPTIKENKEGNNDPPPNLLEL